MTHAEKERLVLSGVLALVFYATVFLVTGWLDILKAEPTPFYAGPLFVELSLDPSSDPNPVESDETIDEPDSVIPETAEADAEATTEPDNVPQPNPELTTVPKPEVEPVTEPVRELQPEPEPEPVETAPVETEPVETELVDQSPAPETTADPVPVEQSVPVAEAENPTSVPVTEPVRLSEGAPETIETPDTESSSIASTTPSTEVSTEPIPEIESEVATEADLPGSDAESPEIYKNPLTAVDIPASETVESVTDNLPIDSEAVDTSPLASTNPADDAASKVTPVQVSDRSETVNGSTADTQLREQGRAESIVGDDAAEPAYSTSTATNMATGVTDTGKLGDAPTETGVVYNDDESNDSESGDNRQNSTATSTEASSSESGTTNGPTSGVDFEELENRLSNLSPTDSANGDGDGGDPQGDNETSVTQSGGTPGNQRIVARNLQELTNQRQIIRRVEPDFSDLLEENPNLFEGKTLIKVRMSFDIDPQGLVLHPAFVQSSGSTAVDNKIREALRQWKFVPLNSEQVQISQVADLPWEIQATAN